MKKVALIFELGQDGSYLAELLLKNYIVHGVKRRSSSVNTSRIDHIYKILMTRIISLDYIMEILQILHLNGYN